MATILGTSTRCGTRPSSKIVWRCASPSLFSNLYTWETIPRKFSVPVCLIFFCEPFSPREARVQFFMPSENFMIFMNRVRIPSCLRTRTLINVMLRARPRMIGTTGSIQLVCVRLDGIFSQTLARKHGPVVGASLSCLFLLLLLFCCVYFVLLV